MTAYWLAQGVGVIAFLIGITTFFNRDERRFKKQLSVYSAIIGVHFLSFFRAFSHTSIRHDMTFRKKSDDLF